MVAFTKTYNRRGGTAAKFPLTTTVNKPIKKIYKKRPKATKANVNKQAIMKMARQVKTLQNQRYGEVQSHTQFAILSGDNKPLNARPILFGLNNFYDQEIYSGHVSNGIATYAQAGTLVRQTYRSDLDDAYEWNARRNSDAVSLVEYKPVFTRLNLTFYFNPATAVYPAKVRVTILKVKPYISSSKLNVALPATLGAYRWLANSSASSVTNYFDKRYHTILQDKWINVVPPANNPQTQFSREVRIDYRYGNDVLKPDITSTPGGQNFWTNTNVKDQIWVLVSTDTDPFMDNMRISKFDVWRDPHGV